MRKSNKKKLLTGMMAAILVVGMNSVPANAASVTTDVHSSSGGYVLYVRKSGSDDLLGTMSFSKDSSYVYNTFTASQDCKTTTAYVSGSSTGYQSKTVSSLSIGASVIAKKKVSNPTVVYGYCTVGY